MLYKDERVANVAAVPQYPFLEKMLMERLVTKCAQVTKAAPRILSWSWKADGGFVFPCTSVCVAACSIHAWAELS